MRAPHPGMKPATAAFTTVYDTVFRRPIETLDLAGIRKAREAVFPATRPFTWITGPVAKGVRTEDSALPVRDGSTVPVRTYRPGGSDLPVIVYFHGGGWVQGSTRMYDPLCSHLAAHVGAMVVSVDYRLAPEHKAPQAAHDCVDAATWVADHAPGLGATPRLAVCGDSAGGNLAAVVAQQFRDRGDDRLRHQALIYPAVDMTMSSPSMGSITGAPILPRRSIDAFKAHYLVGSGIDETDPIVSPLYGELAGVAPALVQTADVDPLRDEGRWYADALLAAGVNVRFTNYVGVPHGFASFPGVTGIGAQHRAELVTELARHLAR